MMWVVVETWAYGAWGPFKTRALAAAFAKKKGRNVYSYFLVRKVRSA